MRLLAIIVLFAIVGTAHAELHNDADIDGIIGQLGSRDYFVREAATSQLVERGVTRLPAIIRHIDNDDPEIAWRIRFVICEIAKRGDKVAVAKALASKRYMRILMHSVLKLVT